MELSYSHSENKVLMYKYETLNMGKYSTCTVSFNYRIAATLYTVETWFVCYININILHEIGNSNIIIIIIIVKSFQYIIVQKKFWLPRKTESCIHNWSDTRL
jgi:hypothetical protein